MSLFLPTVSVGKATDITPELIRAMDANAILLDVDNTLALHGSQTPFPGTVEWAKHMRKAGIRLVLVSNNFKKRVEPFAAKYGLPFLSLSLKPFPAAYHRAVRRLGVEPGEAVVVGDQIFTDVFGANWAGIKSILLVPAGMEQSLSFRLRRALEKPIRRKIKEKGCGSQFTK
ncbi:Phosphoglycolate phosphatase [Caprobacter fermentans]|uniref:Phosphoglycolate phosphatase n=1 Tax=Caproicibacter fermentans TaxID=2576756 RepID=A0A6N8I082_9FIRM|nr:YqeG family HAD IIIA-type phosphatase [Caproicibacter fermentans]MVB11521.1 Phosphoglycolate phosphatase [Caproicibacter fermentans]OCN02717.1 hydrolase [Clostridium sp. W14A]QNK41042.1 YqeG family HAD IIIA-type phosphatase [Caproicibacter fermentans]